LKGMKVPTLGFVHNARRGARRSRKRDEKEASNLFLQYSERLRARRTTVLRSAI
jgi:hypothetical protein